MIWHRLHPRALAILAHAALAGAVLGPAVLLETGLGLAEAALRVEMQGMAAETARMRRLIASGATSAETAAVRDAALIDAGLAVDAPTAVQAVAALQARLGALVADSGGRLDRIAGREPEALSGGLVRLGFDLALSAPVAALPRLVQRLETARPLLLIGEMAIERRQAPGLIAVGAAPRLEIRLRVDALALERGS